MQKPVRHPASYRDPSGFIFNYNGQVYRQVNQLYKRDFDKCLQSGLYEHLISSNKLISHQILAENLNQSGEWYTTLKPDNIPFIAYPYEWCFEMWKDAALLTLDITCEAIKYGMLLKDASAYNLQWHRGRMMFIDSLSFEVYDTSKPWIAYKQFCEHFLAPLALMHYLKTPIQNMFLGYANGIPVTVAKKFLPFRSKLNLHTFLHLHFHGKQQSKKQVGSQSTSPFSDSKLKNILSSLYNAINDFRFDDQTGVWSEYYKEASTRINYLDIKKDIVLNWVEKMSIKTVIDLGANEGEFSETLSFRKIFTICVDFDHYSINKIYKKSKTLNNSFLYPILMDLTQPSPGIGVNNIERSSFIERTSMDLVLALALIHHLVIGKNLSFDDIAILFSNLGKNLIVEYIPKHDEMIQLMFKSKNDIYHWYNEEAFLNIFKKHYEVIENAEIGKSGRKLFLMQRL